jgi:hypothetical protein
MPDVTKEQVRAWLGDLKRYWEPEHKRQELNAEYYWNEYEVDPAIHDEDLIAEPYVLRQGRSGEIVDRAFGLLDVHTSVSIDAPGKKAEGAEAWANLARPQAEREQGEDTDSRATFEAVLQGVSGIKVLPNPKLWRGKYPKQQSTSDVRAYNKAVKQFGEMAPLPVSVWHIPSRTWYPLLNGRNVIRSLECKKVTKAWVEARYGDILAQDDRDQMTGIADEIELVEHVDDTECGWYLFGPEGSELTKELKTWPHRMPVEKGVAPVVLVEGITTGDTRPGYRWKGLLDDIRDVIKAQDFALSRTATMVQIFYWLTVIHTIKEGGATLEELKKQRPFVIGGTNFILPNEEFQIMGLPSELPDAEQLYAKTEERLRRAWPDVLAGITGGETSGYAFNIARDAALTRLKPIQTHMATADADVAWLMFAAVGALEKKLQRKSLTVYVRQADDEGVRSIGINWDQVKDLRPLIRAKREADLAVDIHSKIDAAIKAWTQLHLPWDHVISEIYGAENPEELSDARELEDIENDPQVVDRKLQDVFLEMNDILNEQEGMPLDELAAEMGGGMRLPPAFVGALGQQQATPQGAGPNIQQTNPRAGTATQPSGPRIQPGAPDVPGVSV